MVEAGGRLWAIVKAAACCGSHGGSALRRAISIRNERDSRPISMKYLQRHPACMVAWCLRDGTAMIDTTTTEAVQSWPEHRIRLPSSRSHAPWPHAQPIERAEPVFAKRRQVQERQRHPACMVAWTYGTTQCATTATAANRRPPLLSSRPALQPQPPATASHTAD